MGDIRQQISEWLAVDSGRLNEISLEDVRFGPTVQNNIGSAVIKMLSLDHAPVRSMGLSTYQDEALPCKGFWIEETKELVVYLSVSNQLKAIVVPHDGWALREDIVLN